MTALEHRPRRGLGLRAALWLIVPSLGLGYQFCAEKIAQAMAGQPLDVSWFLDAARLPWVWVMLAVEALTFAAWMTVLSDTDLSEAFPMTAIGYLLVIGLGWGVFHEAVHPLAIVGGVLIMAGIALLGRGLAKDRS